MIPSVLQENPSNPHVVPVGFRYNAGTNTIDIGGHDLAHTAKWRQAAHHPRVAFVVDDVLPPWQPRCIEIRAEAELLESGGQELGPGFGGALMRLHPVWLVAWGIDEERRTANKQELSRFLQITQLLHIQGFD